MLVFCEMKEQVVYVCVAHLSITAIQNKGINII